MKLLTLFISLLSIYSHQLIDGNIYSFYCNTKHTGFYDFRSDSVGIAPQEDEMGKLDYVSGLVAKAVIEAADYYQHDQASAQEVASWVKTMQHYANTYYASVPRTGGSLDDLNAAKLYIGLRALTREGATYEDSLTAAHCTEAIAAAREGLQAHHAKYRNAEGGWWHKSNYIHQMWCDGQYMGPALLAQIIAEGDGTITGNEEEDWALVARQFEIAWSHLWDKKAGLLWHAYSAEGDAYNETTHAETWATNDLHSATYWGRAEGWYFMALIDVLEQMQRVGRVHTPAYKQLSCQLNQLAKGLAKRQDPKSHCWYQLLGEDSTFYATTYQGEACDTVYNYLESSCSFLFAACYMKAARLGLFKNNKAMMTLGRQAYEGAIARFWDGEKLIDCCASAGLGGKGKACAAGGKKCRDGSREYYLLGYDVTRVTTYTEGKVLGAAILASVEYERSEK